MINQTLYKIELYSPAGGYVANLNDYETLEWGEKFNDFSDCKISFNSNKLTNSIKNNFQPGCEIKVKRRINGVFLLVWAGKLTNADEFSVDNVNKQTTSAIFKHWGKDFLSCVYIKKNYNVPTDEGVVLSDLILFSQTPTNYTALGYTVTTNEANWNVTIGAAELTGNLVTQDFSQKEVTLEKAIGQIIEAKDPANTNKQFFISPSITNNQEKQFYFFKNRNTKIQANFYGFSGNTLINGGGKQNIMDLKTTGSEYKNMVTGQGDNISSYQRADSSTGLVQAWKARIKYQSFKNVAVQDALDDLTKKDLEKNQNPTKLVELTIMPNDDQICKFGAGDYIRVRYDNKNNSNKSLSGDFRIYEIGISYSNLGLETCTVKIAVQDPVSLSNPFEKALLLIKQSQDRLQILEQN